MSIPKSNVKAKMHPVEPKSLKTNSKPPNHFDKKPNRTPNHVKFTLLLRNHLKKIKSGKRTDGGATSGKRTFKFTMTIFAHLPNFAPF